MGASWLKGALVYFQNEELLTGEGASARLGTLTLAAICVFHTSGTLERCSVGHHHYFDSV